jgi:alanine dehydrogenase
MPGAVPLTSTVALTNATLPYALEIADNGWRGGAQDKLGFREGLNVVCGKVTYAGVADAFGLDYTPVEEVLVLEG